MIPAVVIHCVNEVAARGLVSTGIYRVPGSDKRVNGRCQLHFFAFACLRSGNSQAYPRRFVELLEKFIHGRGTPSLALVDDINVVCSAMKCFLRMLDEPLVTYSLRPDFLTAAEQVDRGLERAKYKATTLLDRLPTPNRDTLAYVILHLKVRNYISIRKFLN